MALSSVSERITDAAALWCCMDVLYECTTRKQDRKGLLMLLGCGCTVGGVLLVLHQGRLAAAWVKHLAGIRLMLPVGCWSCSAATGAAAAAAQPPSCGYAGGGCGDLQPPTGGGSGLPQGGGILRVSIFCNKA
jgi:hypothetical protein